jgi:hypothetical protein
MNRYLFTILLLLWQVAANAQTFIPGQTYFSDSGYIEYRCGNIPVIFSAPHDGDLEPTQIPDRTCNNPTLVRDIRCADVARALDTAFMNQYGCRPHIIICHLHRKKMDANRDLADGACGNAAAENAWQAFHNYLDTARALATADNGRGFYIDFHGHGHDTQQLELGYLLSKTELQLADTFLDNHQYDTTSSIRYLSQNNQNSESFSQLLRGPNAFGTLLANMGYPSVPSQQKPFPPGTEPYFNGGYNTANYTSYMGGTIDGLQIESNWDGVRDNNTNRKKFADSLRSAIVTYMGYHMFGSNNFIDCTSAVQKVETQRGVVVYPNPGNGSFSISGPDTEGAVYRVYDIAGKLVAEGVLNSEQVISLQLADGAYFMQLWSDGKGPDFFKLLIAGSIKY